jgi:putative transposase
VKKRFTDEQIIGFFKTGGWRGPVRELCRQHGFSDARSTPWRAKFGRDDGI